MIRKDEARFWRAVFLSLVLLGGARWAPAGVVDGLEYEIVGAEVSITGCLLTGGAAIIPDRIEGLPVTRIGDGAFQYSAITSAILPGGVTSIGDAAFYYCRGLTEVVIPNSVNRIGDSAFRFCERLTEVVLPEGLEELAGHTFSDCIGLGRVRIPNGVTSIGDWAFSRCRLYDVNIPDSVTRIGEGAFYGSGPETVVLPESVTSIGASAFEYCILLNHITVPSQVTTIAERTFSECRSLTNVTLAGAVTRLEPQAFHGCLGLTRIRLPESVDSLGKGVFSDCGGLTHVVIPARVEVIADNAFSACRGLTSVILPDNITRIGKEAFSDCSQLTNVVLSARLELIDERAFSGCRGLTSVRLPDSVTRIGNYGFSDCSQLTNVVLSARLELMGELAFWGCGRLGGIDLPRTLSSVGEDAFRGCDSLTRIEVDPANPYYRSVEGVLFDAAQTTLLKYPNAKKGAYVAPGTVVGIAKKAFAGCANLTAVTLNESVATVGESAFYGCAGLTNVILGPGVASVGNEAFAACNNLQAVYFVGDTPWIGNGIFRDDERATVYYLGGFWDWDATFGGRPTQAYTRLGDNHAPTVAHALPDQFAMLDGAFSLTIPADAFADTDVGQTLSYRVGCLPDNFTFNAATRTLSGVATHTGAYLITVTAIDNGSPALRTKTQFALTIHAMAPVALAALGAGDGQFTLEVQGTAGLDYAVLRTEDFTGWTPVYTNRAAPSVWRFTDSVKPGTRRFYRVAAQAPPPSPSFPDMVFIPAGDFLMGTRPEAMHAWNHAPLHSVNVSGFYMDRNEVTKALWDEVATLLQTDGYRFDPPGSGKATHHPVTTISWYDCVKWCNARSQKEGLTPCYYTDAGLTTVYRRGVVDPYVNWTANGYRLPTEAEWEKAARGGNSGQRFPWSDSDTIEHTRANYRSTGEYAFDTSATPGYHPGFLNGGEPFTSPVASFAANGYGLNDMAGNVYEWCWDLRARDYYDRSPVSDPHGPDSTSDEKPSRVFRGGSWGSEAIYCQVDWRSWADPGYSGTDVGFRTVRTPGR